MADQKQQKIEYGDFQTPIDLAREVCLLVAKIGFRPASVLEPTCGTGSFLQAALETFPDASRFLGFEINKHYVEYAHEMTARIAPPNATIEIHQSDFFHTDWLKIVEELPEPILVIGNPPWVTNAELGILRSNNIPEKVNLDNRRGIDALTGKSNFDISEWMLRSNLEWLNNKCCMLAVLCKTTVARKVLLYSWQKGLSITSASLYKLDAKKYFGANVDACLLFVKTDHIKGNKECIVYDSLHSEKPVTTFGLRDKILVSDIKSYDKWKHLAGSGLKGWRSGVKHDCSKVFELHLCHNRLINGIGEFVDLEPEVLFPLLKSSDLAIHAEPHRWMIVSQQDMSEDPSHLRVNAPKAWNYLMAHSHLLDRRRSSIYKSRPQFSLFGIGPYAFSPWKVAISGLYKKLDFVKVPPFQARPVLLDDTCYFFPCKSEDECNVLHQLVTSEAAIEFFSALIFWDSKRPITAQLLNLLDLAALARVLDKGDNIARTLAERQIVDYVEGHHQHLLFREESAEY